MLLIRRRRPTGEPGDATEADDRTPARVLQVLDGTAGAGRICAALLGLGVRLAGVRQAVIEADAPSGDLDVIDVGERFETVALGSHLVNAPDEDRRSSCVRLAARHLADGGRLLVEHHPLDWAETASDVDPTPGAALGMQEVRREPPFVSAVSVYDMGGRVVRQPFRARVLSEAEIAEALATAGLEVRRRLGPTWIEAARAT